VTSDPPGSEALPSQRGLLCIGGSAEPSKNLRTSAQILEDVCFGAPISSPMIPPYHEDAQTQTTSEFGLELDGREIRDPALS
jgi:hypothetical protein